MRTLCNTQAQKMKTKEKYMLVFWFNLKPYQMFSQKC